jgi:hypothetical protein
MSAVQKMLSLGGVDIAGSVKAATDGIANLNLHLARAADNSAAIAERLDAIDAHQAQIMQALGVIVARLPPQQETRRE